MSKISFVLPLRTVVLFAELLIVVLCHQDLTAEEPVGDISSTGPAQAAPSTVTEGAIVDSETIESAPQRVMKVVSRFPRLLHFLFVRNEQFPKPIRDMVVNFSELRRMPIIMNPVSDFDGVGLMNPAGRQVVLELVEGSRLIVLKAGDSLEVEVLLEQESSGAVAEGFWSVRNPGPRFENKQQLVRVRNPADVPFEPGFAVAGAVARHFDLNGGLVDSWSWLRIIELTR